MKKNRILRYREKIEVITKRKENISSWIDGKDEKSILAVYKAYQEMIESFTDIFAMMLKDMGELVKDDYSNIETLRSKGFLNEDEEGLMKEANGLRNRLVHEYNGLERKVAIESIRRINQNLENVIEEIRKWIKEE